MSATKNVMWKYPVYCPSKGTYNKILVRDLLIVSLLNLKIPKHVIKAGYGTLKGPTAPMIDLCAYKFKDLNAAKIIPEEYFMNT